MYANQRNAHIKIIIAVVFVLMALTGCKADLLTTTDTSGNSDSSNYSAPAEPPSQDSRSEDSNTSVPDISSPTPETSYEQQGITEYFSYQNLELEVSHVSSTRTDSIHYADDSWEMDYPVFICYPGAILTVLNPDMSNPAETSDQLPHPRWAIDTTSDTPINLIDGMEPVEIISDFLGVYNREASVYVLRFEMCEE